MWGWILLVSFLLIVSAVLIAQMSTMEKVKSEARLFTPRYIPSVSAPSVKANKDAQSRMYLPHDKFDEYVQKAKDNFVLTRYDYAGKLLAKDPLISIITRNHKKDSLLARNISMAQYMVDKDFEHIILQDTKGAGMQIAETALFAFRDQYLGQYINHSDNDDFIMNLNFTKDMKYWIEKFRPALIIHKLFREDGVTLPMVWQKFPVEGEIDSCNVLFRKDVYNDPSVTSALSQPHAGDYACIYNALIYCQRNKLPVLWVPRVYMYKTVHESTLNDPKQSVFQRVLEDRPLSFVTVKLYGGLGNQLFQVAMAYAYAQKHGKRLILDPTAMNHPMYDWIRRRDTASISWFEHRESQFVAEKISATDLNVRFDGYFQSEQYFEESGSDIRALFLKPYPHVHLPEQNSNCAPVALHVRRGDYVNNPHHVVVPKEYYESALAEIRNKEERKLQVFVFSNGMEWCKENIPTWQGVNETLLTFVEEGSDEEQMVMMSHCVHHVIAASSFSWWGSFLSDSDGVTVAPATWFPPASHIKDWSTVYRKGWIVL